MCLPFAIGDKLELVTSKDEESPVLLYYRCMVPESHHVVSVGCPGVVEEGEQFLNAC